jgi:hypothetical protein
MGIRIVQFEETPVPNRRRRKISTAMSAVGALAVATPVAALSVIGLSTQPSAEHREFTRAAVVTDLPNEILSALQQGLSQFGINLPPLPTGLSPAGAQPVQTGPLSPGLTAPGLTTPGLTTPALTTPGLTTPGLTTPQIGVDPLLTSPAAGTIGLPIEQPISAPLGPVAGTYPILGDPSLGMPMAPVESSGGIISDLSSAANQLGVGQAIDLLKGVLVPGITQAMQGAAAAAPAAAAPAVEAAGVAAVG